MSVHTFVRPFLNSCTICVLNFHMQKSWACCVNTGLKLSCFSCLKKERCDLEAHKRPHTEKIFQIWFYFIYRNGHCSVKMHLHDRKIKWVNYKWSHWQTQITQFLFLSFFFYCCLWQEWFSVQYIVTVENIAHIFVYRS